MTTQQTSTQKVSHWVFIRKVIVRAILFIFLFNALFIIINPIEKGIRLSAYNTLYPGRQRLPFGENSRESYNLSLYDLDAMIASHHIAGVPQKATNEFRVIVLGDSSIWGTLLRPDETFTGVLNQQHLSTQDGKTIVFYNLGYPSMSVTKDLLILDRVRAYQPDLILWGVTLESLVLDTQISVPLAANNQTALQPFHLSYLETNDPSPQFSLSSLAQNSMFGQRRPIADWIRLQVYGFMWGATGIDQSYPSNYPAAMRDFEENDAYRDYQPSTFSADDIALEALQTGISLAGDTPIIIFNEPILISTGKNSQIRYNFLYPRWIYDRYRTILTEHFSATNVEYYDFWNVVPEEEFTNSAVHMTPYGEDLFVQTFIKEALSAIIN